MLTRYQIVDGKLLRTETENGVVHVYISPDEKEKNYLINQLGIDEHTFNSALDPDELCRLEFEANHAAMILKRPKRYTAEDNFVFKITSLGLFLFQDKLVVISGSEDVQFDGRLFQKLRSFSDVCLKLISRCIQHFEEHLNVIHQVSNELEKEINKALTNKDLLYMFSLEKSLVYYLKAVSSTSKLIDKIKSSAVKMNLSQEDTEFMEDVTIEAAQCYEEANTYLQVISNLMDAWVSMVSNNLNFRMKTLTILSICIMLPTLIVSIFSMNVALPLPQREELFPFWLIVGAGAFSVTMIGVLWWHKKW